MARNPDEPTPEEDADARVEEAEVVAEVEAAPVTAEVPEQNEGDPFAPGPAAAAGTPRAHAAAQPSVLERVRMNAVGPLAAGLGVALVVALLLAVLIPDEPNLYAFTVLGLLLTAAVGFTVRYLSHHRGLMSQVTAFVSTVIGLHVMAVTGVVDGLAGGGVVAELLDRGPGFDDALLAALATPAVSTGGILCGLVAAIIVGWGDREDEVARD